MRQSPENIFDVATVLSVGARDYQEDALEAEFPDGAGFGVVVLADGMGGHAAGDIASKIVVSEVIGELKEQTGDIQAFSHNVNDVLQRAMKQANDGLRGHTADNPDSRGMGATLVATVFLNNLLYWLSVGDSPLYLFRDGELKQLNEDHSMAPQIDFMVKNGMLDPEIGANHPDRSCLTSVLIGGHIERIDCPGEAFRMEDGDLLIVASDGIQFLSNPRIGEILEQNGNASAAETADALLTAIDDLDDPDQDNASFAVIRFGRAGVMGPDLEVAWDADDDFGPAPPAAANGTPDENEKPLKFSHRRAEGGRR